MPLPIIVVLERHWDTVPKKALMNALPFLKAAGYDALCFESPCDKSESETIDGIESTLQFIEARLAEAYQCLNKQGIAVNLPAMNYSDLELLLYKSVSSGYSEEMALWFKELSGHKEKLDLVRKAKTRDIQIYGIDLPHAQLEKIHSLEAQTNIGSKVSGIIELDDERTLAFKTNILELQQKGKGVIFLVGQFHYEKLVKEFDREFLLDEILFLHPYSPQSLDSSVIDYTIPPFSDIPGLGMLEQVIADDKDIDVFVTRLQSTVQTMLSREVAIGPTSTSELLSFKSKINFEAYLRPSSMVDGHHFFKSRQAVVETVERLNAQGVHGFFTFFENKESYCVPGINTQGVASEIKNMNI